MFTTPPKISFLICLLLAGAASPASPLEARPQGLALAKLASQLARLTGDFERTGCAKVGISVVDLRTGQVVFARADCQKFIPASNQKLLTSAFALARLGGDFQFTTTIAKIGENLAVIGDIDPTLGDPLLAKRRGVSIYYELDRWARAVRQKSGQTITGSLVLCSRISPDNFFHPEWKLKHRSRWYGAPVADLNFHDNCFDVTFVEQAGEIMPRLAPDSRYIRLINRTRRGSRQLWRLGSSDNDSVVTISGTLRSASPYPQSVAVTDPPMLLGYVLAERLARAGVKVQGGLRRIDSARMNLGQAQVLCRSLTPIFDAISRANKRSLNLAAECLFLRAGDGTWAGSAKLMSRTLIATFDLSPAGLIVSDGGGLSRANRVSPGNVTKLLAAMTSQSYGPAFIESLSRCGQDGTLRKRLRDKKYRGRIAGKTGYIAGVVALSGYVLPAGGNAKKTETGNKTDMENHKPVFAFSILLNSVRNVGRAKQFQNRLCQLLIDAAQ